MDKFFKKINKSRKGLFLLFFFFCLLNFPKKVFAQVVINEFSPRNDPEWIELYNNSDDNVELINWSIVDGNSLTTDDLVLEGCIVSRGFRLLTNPKGWLNDSGSETITLKNALGEVLDQVTYGEGGIVGIPAVGKSAGRVPDGTSFWQIFDSPTPQNDGCVSNITPTLTSTPTLVPTNTPLPSPTPFAVYKINEVKNTSGSTLSNVEIYVDGNYIHHYAPETLNFCGGCQCYAGVNCSLGDHTIKLVKNGYADWSEGKTFGSGSYFEVNPVLSEASPTSVQTTPPQPTTTSVPTITTTKTATLTPTLRASPTLTSYPSLTPGVLGETTTESAEVIELSSPSGEELSGAKEKKGKKVTGFLPLLLIIPGIGMIGYSVFTLLKKRKMTPSPQQ